MVECTQFGIDFFLKWRHCRKVRFRDGVMGDDDIDLDRAVHDPSYRRRVIEWLKRGDSKAQEPGPPAETGSQPTSAGRSD
jgi:hypothetical protein